MYIFVCVPAASRIASATARNRAGPLPMQSPSGGGRARACGGRLQRRGASLPCDTSAIEAGAQGKDRFARRPSLLRQQCRLGGRPAQHQRLPKILFSYVFCYYRLFYNSFLRRIEYAY